MGKVHLHAGETHHDWPPERERRVERILGLRSTRPKQGEELYWTVK